MNCGRFPTTESTFTAATLRAANRAVSSVGRSADWAQRSPARLVPSHDDFDAVVLTACVCGRTGQSPARRRLHFGRFFGPLAQLVEQGTLNPKVEGSNPSRPMSERSPARPNGRAMTTSFGVA